MSTIGERIKMIRKENKDTQERLGEKIGLKQNSIAQIEMGKRLPSDQVCISICREYGISYEWLVNEVGDKRPPEVREDFEIVSRAMAGASEKKKKLMRLIAGMPDELLDKMMEYWDAKK